MRHPILILTILSSLFFKNTAATPFDLTKYKTIHHQLEDVMEIIDSQLLLQKLSDVESQYLRDSSLIHQVRLGIIYHEVALNLSFLNSSQYSGYAQKSFDQLSAALNTPDLTPEIKPFIVSYRASALSLISAETQKIKYLNQAFNLLDQAVKEYAEVCYLPEFLRGSISENLPGIFFCKRRHAKRDMQSIITKYNHNPEYASPKIMSFTYWSWANQNQGKRHRELSLKYLDKAIALDPNYEGGRQRAEELKAQLSQ